MYNIPSDCQSFSCVFNTKKEFFVIDIIFDLITVIVINKIIFPDTFSHFWFFVSTFQDSWIIGLLLLLLSSSSSYHVLGPLFI
jgi:hypothetical protein